MSALSALSTIVTAPLSFVWGMVAGVRSLLFSVGVLREQTYPMPVICVGNLAVGGTGKTPHVEHILRLLHAEGLRPAMLSRGYGRRTKGYILADRSQHTAADIGDEPYQVMQNCPFAVVAVCEKRTVGMERLMALTPDIDVIVLDDAYQHRYVKAGLNILLTDANRLYTRDHLLPWGRLREPARAAKRAHLIVVTKCQGGQRPKLAVDPHQRLFYSRIAYAPLLKVGSDEATENEPDLSGKNVLLIAGIANPEPLRRFLESKGVNVSLCAFADHHAFSKGDARRISRQFDAAQCSVAVTTQKDYTRLVAIGTELSASVREHLYVQPISVDVRPAESTNEFTNPSNALSFDKTIIEYARKNKRNRSVD